MTPNAVAGGSLRTLRPHQTAAVGHLAEALGRDDAAQLHMACGTGKTLVALRAAEQVAPGDALIAVGVPTVALVDQVLREWRADAAKPFSALAVCQDDSMIDAPVHLDDLSAGATTDPAEVIDWIRATTGRRVVVATYHSIAVLAQTLHQTGPADLLVCDEAHHLMGTVDAPWRRVVERGWFPARRRIYATATPRDDLRLEYRSGPSRPVVSAEDHDVFGVPAYRYGFPAAIRDGWLDDYRMVVIGVRERDALGWLRDAERRYVPEDRGSVDLQVVAAQAALAQARARFGIRRAITFHHRVDDARIFAITLAATIEAMGGATAHDPPAARLVHGEMPVAQRHLALDVLRRPPAGGWGVVSNARCLSEGIDIPAVDAVLFGHPKKSAVDIVQAIGRALRRSDPTTQGTATIIVPIVVPDGQADGLLDIDPGEWRVVWRVLAALRAHDEDLGLELNRSRHTLGIGASPQLPEKISVILPPGTAARVVEQVQLMVIRQSTSPWWDSYAAAARYAAEHGHLRVPQRYRDPHGVALGTWLKVQRVSARRLPPDRRAALDEIGMVWHNHHDAWDRMADVAQQYLCEHGHLVIPRSDSPELDRLARWISKQRQLVKAGRIDPARAAKLADRGIDLAPPRDTAWDNAIAACDRWATTHGSLADVPSGYVDEEGFPLGKWLIQRRHRAANPSVNGGGLTPARRAALDARGMRWTSPARAITDDEAEELRAAHRAAPPTQASPEMDRLLLRLIDDGVRLRSVAQALGLNEGSVSARIKRARRRSQ